VPRLLTVCCIFVFVMASASAQQRLKIVKSTLSFTSKAELELIKASSDKLQGLLDPSTNQFAFSVDIISFKGFNSELQREHFNEKYMESERFPKAKFSGKIIEQIDFTSDNTYEVRAKGDLDIHGVKQTRIIKGKLIVSTGTFTLDAHFTVPLSDHNIAVPTLVRQKIATEILVDINAQLQSE
jgi:polyisoprenoid-binding protein YceI